jgi:hypothetical protein
VGGAKALLSCLLKSPLKGETARRAAGARGHEGVTRTEYFRTEYEALQRARQLIEDGDHHAVSLCDSSGSVLAGIRLQLKLGATIAE